MKTMYREIGWLSAEDVEDVDCGQLRTSVMAMAYEAQSMAVPMDPKPRKGKATIIEIENHFQEYKRRFFVVFSEPPLLVEGGASLL